MKASPSASWNKSLLDINIYYKWKCSIETSNHPISSNLDPPGKSVTLASRLSVKKQFVGEINVGTPAYMAPESLERTFYSAKTDFFSLGIICYEMLFGSTPWAHKNEKNSSPDDEGKKNWLRPFIGIKNNNLINFIVKCLEVNERKRMKMEEFESFEFWSEV